MAAPVIGGDGGDRAILESDQATEKDASLSTSLRNVLTGALQELIEAELTAAIGATPGQRTPERVALRNGHRPKLLSTPAGDVEGGIPKLRTGSFLPSCSSHAAVSILRCGR